MSKHQTGQSQKTRIDPATYNRESSRINDLDFALKILEIDPEELKQNAINEELYVEAYIERNGPLRGVRIA